MLTRIRAPLPAARLGGLALALAALLLATVNLPATALAMAPPAGQTIDLTLDSYLATGSAPQGTTLNAMVGAFEKLHPNIKVTLEQEAVTSAAGITTQIQKEEVSGQTPDVAQVTFDGLKFAVSSLGAQQLDKVEGKAALQKAFGGDHPFGKPATRLGVEGGHTYAIPWTLSTPVLFYNPGLLQAAGVSAPPKTWAEMLTDATQIKQKTGADGMGNGCIGASALGSDWCLQAILRSDGGQIIQGNQVRFGDARSVDALKVMQSLAASGGMVDLTDQQAIAEFAAGKLGFYLQTSALQGALLTAIGTKFQLADAPLPGFGSRQSTPTNSGSGLAMLTTDKAKQKAAWELITYLTGDQSETTIAENIGYPPLRPTLIDDPKYLKSWSHASTLLPVNLEQLTRIVPWEAFPGPNFAQIETLFQNSASKVVFQNANPQQTMRQAQSQAQALVSGS